MTDDSRGFWDSASRHHLVIQRCHRCGRLHHPPRPMCPQCHSVEHDWVEARGTGTVYSYAILHHPRHWAFDYPLVVALVDLEEGVRVATNLVDVAPDDVTIGLEVEVAFAPTVDDAAVPVFRPRGRVS